MKINPLTTTLSALFFVLIFLGIIMVPDQVSASGPKTLVLSDSNTVSLNLPIEGEIARDVQLELMAKGNGVLKRDIYLFLNSPGGSITDGLEIVTTAKGLKSQVNTVSMFSASMSFVISQYLGKRYALPNATLMSHRASLHGGLNGEIPGSLLSRLFHMTALLSKQDEIVANRAGLDLADYTEMIRDELWLGAEEAKQHNFIDEVVNVRCDESLSGTKSQTLQIAIFTVDVEFSKCPLITYPVSIKVAMGRNSGAKKGLGDQESAATYKIYSAFEMYFQDKARFMKEYGSFNNIGSRVAP